MTRITGARRFVDPDDSRRAKNIFAQRLTPYPLTTKDGGLLHTIGDARTYMLTLPKTRKLRVHWQHARRLCRGPR